MIEVQGYQTDGGFSYERRETKGEKIMLQIPQWTELRVGYWVTAFLGFTDQGYPRLSGHGKVIQIENGVYTVEFPIGGIHTYTRGFLEYANIYEDGGYIHWGWR